MATTNVPVIELDPVGRFIETEGGYVPDALRDPITDELFTDPVITSEGHTYERAAIEKWLQTHETDPVTGLPLRNRDLTINWAIRTELESFRARVLLIAPDAARWLPPGPPHVDGPATRPALKRNYRREIGTWRQLLVAESQRAEAANARADEAEARAAAAAAAVALQVEAGRGDAAAAAAAIALQVQAGREGATAAAAETPAAAAPASARPPAPPVKEPLPWGLRVVFALVFMVPVYSFVAFLSAGIGSAMLSHGHHYPGFRKGGAVGAAGGAVVFGATEILVALFRVHYGDSNTLDGTGPESFWSMSAKHIWAWLLFIFAHIPCSAALGAVLLPGLGLTWLQAAAAGASGAPVLFLLTIFLLV